MSTIPTASPAANLAAKKRYRAYAGFVTTPKYFDDSPQELLRIAPGIGVQQRVTHIPGYAYQLGQRAHNFELLEESAICLAEAKCEVVGQVGTNWVHCTGTSPDDIRRICDGISDKAGVPFMMAGQCIVDGLRELGAKKITVATGYYRDDWTAGICRYLADAGFQILWQGDVIAAGLVKDHAEKLAIEDASHWDYPDHLIAGAALEAHRRAPEADAIVQTGSGFRMMRVVETVEAQTGKPLVASDFALYWAMLKSLKLTAVYGQGTLLASLGQEG